MYKSIRSFVARSSGVRFSAPTLTQSQFQRDCDINVMIRRALSGDINAIARGHVVDASRAPDSLHEAFDVLARANTAWEELPAAVKHTYGSKERFVQAFDSAASEIVAARSKSDDKEDKKEKVSPGKGEDSTSESAQPNT